MATINNTIELQDKMSKRLNGLIKKIESTQRAMDKFGKTATFNDLNMQKSLVQARAGIEAFMQTEGLAITQTNKLGHAVGKTSSVFDKLRKSMIAQFSLGAIIANFVTRAIYAIGDMIKMSIMMASDLVETQNVINVAFRGNTKVVDEWSKHTLDKFGLNELSAKKYAGRMSAMLQSGGIPTKQAGEMSMKLTELAGDLSSFYNISNKDAFTKVRAGMAGMVMPLRQLGIDMTVASLSAHALSMGITAKWKSLSQAQKELVRYDYLMKVTQAIHGDFSRTYYSFANQQRLVVENWSMFTAHLASFFLPIMALVLLATNNIIKGLSYLGMALKYLMPYIIGVTAVIIAFQIPAMVMWMGTMLKTAAVAMYTGLQIAGAWIIANWPLALCIAGIIALIAILKICGVTFEQVTGFAGMCLYGLVAIIKNVGIAIGKYIIGEMQKVLLMWDLITAGIDKVAHTKFNVHVKGAEKVVNDLQNNLKYADVGAEGKKGYEAGKKFGLAVKSGVGQLFKQPNFGVGEGGFGSGASDVAKGTKGDPIYTKMDDNDIKALVKVAEVNMVNKFIKMKPTLQASFGDVHETADVHGLMATMADMLEEANDSALGE